MVKETLRHGRFPITLCLTEEIVTLHPPISTLENVSEYLPPLSLDLIGCDLSSAIISELSESAKIKLNLHLKDICPLHAGREASSRVGVHGVIVRCCKVLREIRTLHSNKKPIVVLSWTPSIGEFVHGINNVVRLILKVTVD
jgi:hypothetical protein